MTNAPVLAIDHLWYAWDARGDALRDISLTVYENDVVAIAGENGAGKSTLLSVITGLARPSRGTVYIHGRDARALSVADISREIGLVMQESDSQLFSPTVYEEAAFALKAAKLPRDEIQRRVEAALDAAGLSAWRDSFPPALRRGERTLAVLAAVLAMGAKIIILDEPFAGQDWRNCRRIMDIARALHEKGCTIIFVTHNMALAACARRIVVMKAGRVCMDGAPADIFSREEELLDAGIIPPPAARLSNALRPELPLERTALSAAELRDMLIAFKLKRIQHGT